MEETRKEKLKELKLQIASIIARKEQEIRKYKEQNKQAEKVLKALFEDDITKSDLTNK
ncbi:MAG: hypothetical protein ACOCP8_06845 [archaeon]